MPQSISLLAGTAAVVEDVFGVSGGVAVVEVEGVGSGSPDANGFDPVAVPVAGHWCVAEGGGAVGEDVFGVAGGVAVVEVEGVGAGPEHADGVYAVAVPVAGHWCVAEGGG